MKRWVDIHLPFCYDKKAKRQVIFLATVTQTVRGMQEQNKVFAELEPHIYKRAMLMAADIKKTIIERGKKDQAKKRDKGGDLLSAIWRNHC